jgi:hypothetical protein
MQLFPQESPSLYVLVYFDSSRLKGMLLTICGYPRFIVMILILVQSSQAWLKDIRVGFLQIDGEAYYVNCPYARFGCR